MSTGFDEEWAVSVVRQLSNSGVEFTEGLGDDGVAEIGAVFATEIPVELGLFLRVGVPTSPRWARWIDGAQAVFEACREWIDRAFAFDIERNQYWHPLFGARPAELDAAIDQALAIVRCAPPLLPIYAHRFITTSTVAPRPVLSVWQAADSIFYGNDLADYFAHEFHIDRPEWATASPPHVPIWEDLFDLLCEGVTDEPPGGVRTSAD